MPKPLLLFLLASCSPVFAATRPFTDSDLHRAEKRGEALLYTWSPHMNLSVRGLDQALERARHGGPRVVALLDPGCNRALAEKIARAHHWPREALRELSSRELDSLGLRLHFPSYAFISPTGRIGLVIPGYKTGKELAWFRQHSSSR